MKRLALAATVFSCATSVSVAQDVTPERLRSADREPQSWLTYSGSYSSQRFSPLAQIRPDNVRGLRPAWVYQMREGDRQETTPLVADGVMYVTENRGPVVALDARTGRLLWRYVPRLSKDVKILGFGPSNRGVALLGGSVYVGTLDARLVALDAVSGAVRWEVPVADNALGYAITGAPLAVDDKILVGVAGGEAGIRGFLDAYDAKTGRRVWRFHTVPAPREPGSETWSGDAWKTGGGPTWVTGSYDPEERLVYWGVGNPAPDWNGDSRPGDNLFTCSVIALDVATGALRWHFQFTPHDVHDWDANQIPVLLDASVGGRPRKLLALANRNAFFYLLDRKTGEFLLGEPYAQQTWARGLDAKGRPVLIEGAEPTVGGTLVRPSLQGATNWFSPAFSPKTGLFYVSVREMASTYHKGEAAYVPGEYFMGGGETIADAESAHGAVRALDPLSGKRKWEFRLLSPPWSGLLVAAGGLLFGGTNEGNMFALDAATGAPLWDFQTGGAISANPISFEIDGKQHVAMAAGAALFVFALP